MNIAIDNGELSNAEREGVRWLCVRRGWAGATVRRRESRTVFDLIVNDAWFMQECLFEFWAMGIFGIGRRVGTFVYGLPPTTVYSEFDRVLKLAASKPLFSRELISAVHQVWQEIASDMQGPHDNAEAIETLLDADRIEMLGNKAVAAELKWLDDRFGPARVSAALVCEVRLV